MAVAADINNKKNVKLYQIVLLNIHHFYSKKLIIFINIDINT
jgi:hypothetical protein